MDIPFWSLVPTIALDKRGANNWFLSFASRHLLAGVTLTFVNYVGGGDRGLDVHSTDRLLSFNHHPLRNVHEVFRQTTQCAEGSHLTLKAIAANL